MSENTKECAWVEFDDNGNQKTCPYDDCNPWENESDRDKFCKWCLKGQKVSALNLISQVIWNYAEKEDLT